MLRVTLEVLRFTTYSRYGLLSRKADVFFFRISYLYYIIQLLLSFKILAVLMQHQI